jgi:hypothetical protein
LLWPHIFRELEFCLVRASCFKVACTQSIRFVTVPLSLGLGGSNVLSACFLEIPLSEFKSFLSVAFSILF